MTKVLLIQSSASGSESVSNQLTNSYVERLEREATDLKVIRRDLGSDPLPHLDPARLPGIAGDTSTAAAEETLQLSNTLIEEIEAADILVIGSPMYNYGITSTLKVWFDHIMRAGKTFGYTAEGPTGHLTGKRAIVVETRGGFYSEGPGKSMDAQEPHLTAMLGLVGISDVTFIHAERLAVGPDERAEAIAKAGKELAAL